MANNLQPAMLQPIKHVLVGDVAVKIPANPVSLQIFRAPHADQCSASDGSRTASTARKRYGIPYKDACQRLYHEEHQRILLADANAKAWHDLEVSADNALWDMRSTRDTIRDTVAEENKRAQKK